jgi:hypothetical protein
MAADNNAEPRGAKRRLADAIPTRSIIAITVGFETLQFEVVKRLFAAGTEALSAWQIYGNYRPVNSE